MASIPHLNALVGELDPAKFQFISIDNEDPKLIRAFLAKKKMSGWVGVDTTSGVAAWYGANSLPTTIVVGADGKVVAATSAESLQADDLRALADGKKVAFKAAMEDVKVGAASAVTVGKSALAAVSLRIAAADAKPATVMHAPTGTDLLGVDADTLFTNVFDITTERFVLKGSMPEGLFDLRVNVADAEGDAEGPAKGMLQQALLAGLRMKVQSKTITRRAYVLRRVAGSAVAVEPPASNHRMMRGYWHGRYVVISATMDDLAYVLATGLQAPVVNETEMSNRFDVRFKIAVDDIASLNAVLRKMLGVELVEGEKEMALTVQELSSMKSDAASSDAATQ